MQAPDQVLTPVGEIEQRMGIPPLEVLLAERDDLVRQVARLRALYGPGGTFDAQRKIELSKAAAVVRAQAVLEGKKVTESYLDEAAHTSNGYVDFIIQATSERADWILLEARIEGIDFTINRGQAVAKYLANEVSLSR
jgi:hypothetical protein